MKIKPILFSTPMVQAILNGTKTQTRRLKGLDSFNNNPDCYRYDGQSNYDDQPPFYRHYLELLHLDGTPTEQYTFVDCEVKKGDILWVRETFEKVKIQNNSVSSTNWLSIYKYNYKADGNESFIKWKPSIFMPKQACRIWLKVTNVRVERLLDISESDAIAEGINYHFSGMFQENRFKDYLDPKSDYRTAYSSFQSLWESINGLDSWNTNPWVWVYDFERCEMPKDFLNELT